jgi:hypothetical protein
VGRIHDAGMKAIIKAYSYAPTFFPDDWYLRDPNGIIQREHGPANAVMDYPGFSTLSYWNPEAWAYHLDFIERCCQRYNGPDTLCINISPANGEALVAGVNCLFDKYAIDSYREFVRVLQYEAPDLPGDAVPGSPTLEWLRATVIPAQIQTQRIFHKYGGEYWTMLHHAFETQPNTGNWLIDDLYRALHQELGDEHWGICYTVFRPGETRGLWGPERDVKRHGIRMLFAAEGPAGLLQNTMKAIRMGARGMLCGPLMPYAPYRRMEDWMCEAIKTTSQWWEGK